VIETDELKIPHSDFHNRCFVLKPIVDIAPEFKSPVHHKTVLQIFNRCQDQTKIELVSTNWYSNGIEI
jgi:7,8-dihydro-6-hydroxymethylpterin-pyrophosphokinase